MAASTVPTSPTLPAMMPMSARLGSTEMALHVLAYNLKRAMAILGVPKLRDAIGGQRLPRDLRQADRFCVLTQPPLQSGHH